MQKEKAATQDGTPEAARNSTGDNRIIHPRSDRRQFIRNLFGRTLTVLVAVAEASGDDALVDTLLARKSAWLRRGRR